MNTVIELVIVRYEEVVLSVHVFFSIHPHRSTVEFRMELDKTSSPSYEILYLFFVNIQKSKLYYVKLLLQDTLLGTMNNYIRIVVLSL